jgi:hypothetical protein
MHLGLKVFYLQTKIRRNPERERQMEEKHIYCVSQIDHTTYQISTAKNYIPPCPVARDLIVMVNHHLLIDELMNKIMSPGTK